MPVERSDDEVKLTIAGAVVAIARVDRESRIGEVVRIFDYTTIEDHDDQEGDPMDRFLDHQAALFDDEASHKLTCSFCGKGQHEVKKLIAGPTSYICDECIGLCAEIVAHSP